jgi:hypothetical protein
MKQLHQSAVSRGKAAQQPGHDKRIVVRSKNGQTTEYWKRSDAGAELLKRMKTGKQELVDFEDGADPKPNPKP